MYFPMIERRIAARDDRRSHSPDRRQALSSHSCENNRRNKIVRRNGNDRRVMTLDRETLLLNAASVLATDNQKIKEEKSKFISVCSTILIPLTIGLSSLGATLGINHMQMESAKVIADQQKESAELIAKGQQKNAAKIAGAQIATQHLEHLVEIFSSIISPKDDKDKVIVQRIRSLVVYGEEALPFLLQIRQHFKEPANDQSSSTNPNLYLAAEETIKVIIGYNHLNLSGQKIIGKKGAFVNLRHKIYNNYNLDRSEFTYVNLYKANFSGSSLQSSSFTSADLQEAIFKYVNLKKVKFVNSNLRKTDFRHAYLDGVTISPDCTNIEYAIFSLNTLLKAESDLFKSFNADKYALLLINHKEQLEKINIEAKSKLDAVYTKSNTNNFEELQEKLNMLRNKGLAGIKNKPKANHQLSMNTN